MNKRLLVSVLVLFQPVFIISTSAVMEDADCVSAGADAGEAVVYNVAATVYHPDPLQCDSDYTITADGSEIDTLNPSKHRWIAVSRDMLVKHGGILEFGDSVLVEGTCSRLDGVHIVRDVMNKRYEKRIDFLVAKDDIYGMWEDVRLERHCDN